MPKPQMSDRKILPDDLPRIVQLFKEGNTQTDIGLAYGVDHSTIRYYLCQCGAIISGKRYWRRSLKKEASLVCVLELDKKQPSMCLAEVVQATDGKPAEGKSYKEYLAADRKFSIRLRASMIREGIRRTCAVIEEGV